MKIGIIVYSKTGTTARFGRIILESLKRKGHLCELVELKADQEIKPHTEKDKPAYRFTNLPDCRRYDAIAVGGPVWAFTACPVIIRAIKELNDIKNKKAIPFVTMSFPFAFMGGRRAVMQMSKALSDRGAEIIPGPVVPKILRNQDSLMRASAEQIAALL
jgi:flavorubredoxin